MTTTEQQSQTRTFITTAQVRAQDLHDDDFILLEGEWRAMMDIHRNSDSVMSMVSDGDRDLSAIKDEIAAVRMDTRQNGAPGVQGQISRPGTHPAVFASSEVNVLSHPGNDGVDERTDTRTVRTTSAIAALLDSGEYVAARFVLDEASDGSVVDDAWAVFRQWDLVTVQIEEVVTA
ncbi:hypothetical protein [Microbacterium forte]|uniref:hypothetical protein n=1 Tax=Microbacterium forte TaxID=2982533 RepID=UPI002892E48C|nr:hypothetical protein [Microbacterium sp. A(2022)]